MARTLEVKDAGTRGPAAAGGGSYPVGLTALEARLLDNYQRGFPLVPRPYAEIARDLGVSEEVVIACLASLEKRGMLSRIGAVFRPNRAGASTLAAMAVPPERLAEVAELVSAYPEVNHNYEREHALNLWFVVAAPARERVQEILGEIRRRARLPVLDLRLLSQYHIDLGFRLWR